MRFTVETRKSMNEPETTRQIVKRESGPARFQLISPEGHKLGIYDTALEAASAAGGFWPGVGQRDGDGPGWDIHVMGVE